VEAAAQSLQAADVDPGVIEAFEARGGAGGHQGRARPQPHQGPRPGQGAGHSSRSHVSLLSRAMPHTMPSSAFAEASVQVCSDLNPPCWCCPPTC
jgi:hypothetical protein